MWRWPHERQPLSPRVALAFAIVLWFLALDEGVELHDRAGRWLWQERGVVAPGPIHHVDDVMLLGYVAVAAILGLMLLRSLFKHPRFLAGLCIVGGMLAYSTISDAVGPTQTWTDMVEESIEATATVVLAVVMWRAAWPGVEAARNASRTDVTPAPASALAETS
jgi:hypothetical protein